MGHDLAGLNACFPVDHRLEQSAGLKHPLDEDIPLSLPDKSDRAGSALQIILGVYDLFWRELLPRLRAMDRISFRRPTKMGRISSVSAGGKKTACKVCSTWAAATTRLPGGEMLQPALQS